MAQIFVSYSRNDGVFTRKLVKDLRLLGLQVWIDVDEVQAGKKWSSVVNEALNTTRVMILIVSPDAMQSPNVENEWQRFYDQKKTIIPILYHPAPMSFEMGRIQYIDFFTTPYANAFNELSVALRNQGLLTLPVEDLSKTDDEPPKEDTSTESRSARMISLLDRYIAMRRSGESTKEIKQRLESDIHKLTLGERQAFVDQAKKWEENKTEHTSSQTRGRGVEVKCPACNAFNPRSARFCHHCSGRLDDATPTSEIKYDLLNGVAKCTLMLTVMGQLIKVDFNDVVILGRSKNMQQLHYTSDENTGEEICFVNLEAYNAEKKGVSRQHASLTLMGRSVMIKDMGSTNHSYLGAQWLMPDVSQTLINGDVIRLSTLELRVNYHFND